MDTENLEAKLSNGAGRLEDATEAAKDRIGAAAERALGVFARATDQASDAYDVFKTRAQTTADTTDAFVQARPYAAVGLAVLGGFILGALMLSRGPKVIYIKPARVQSA